MNNNEKRKTIIGIYSVPVTREDEMVWIGGNVAPHDWLELIIVCEASGVKVANCVWFPSDEINPE